MTPTWIEILETAYAEQADEETWLRAVLHAARPLLDRGLGVIATMYDASTPPELATRSFVAEGVGDAGGAFLSTAHMLSWDTVQELASKLGPCATMSETLGAGYLAKLGRAAVDADAAPGVADVLAVDAKDASRCGCLLAALLPSAARAEPAEARLWSQVAGHLAAAARLRGALAAPGGEAGGAEAILDAELRVEHAEGAAATRDARASIRAAARAIDRARGALRRSDPESAVGMWRVLVDGRWSLCDCFDHDGRRYVVARVNPQPSAPRPRLSPREDQIVALASLGHSDKLIGYELGLTESAVAVHLHRARRKLGVRSRTELAHIQTLKTIATERVGSPAATGSCTSPVRSIRTNGPDRSSG
jgi:DNA-binding CsgD family transcriptional regulator